MLLRSLYSPAVSFDLAGLADGHGLLLVGRESDAALRMEAAEVPLLLSRRHAKFTVNQAAGTVHLADLSSTNGTYAARQGQPLQKLSANQPWQVLDGDMLGFGGPENVFSNNTTTRNPFIFRAYQSHVQQAQYVQAEQRDDIIMQGDQLGSGLAQTSPDDKGIVHATPAAPAHALPRLVLPCEQLGCGDTSSRADQSDAGDRATRKTMQPQGTVPGTPGTSLMCSVLASHLSCPICHDWMVACHALTCGHMFCGPCVARWLDKNNNCPTCRSAVAGLPVRCFQVDSTINELLSKGLALASPSSTGNRSAKQNQWEAVQGQVAVAWAAALERRQQRAVESAARFHRGFMAQEPFPDAA